MPSLLPPTVGQYNVLLAACSAAGSGSRVAVVPRAQGRRHRGAVLRRDRHAGAARHVAQGRPGNDVIGARARDADARQDSRRGPEGRRRVHVHVPQRRRARLAHHQARHRGSVT